MVVDAVVVRGNTFPFRDDLRARGFHWDAGVDEWWMRSKGLREETVRWLESRSGIEVEFGPRVVLRKDEEKERYS